jgi:hypothetical protein
MYLGGVRRKPMIDQSVERASLIELTCQEIAARVQNSSDLVLRVALETAEETGRPVDDVLRDWFRALVL